MSDIKYKLEQIKDGVDLSPPTVSFEFFPTKSDQAKENQWQVIKKFEKLEPKYVSVTYGAGGSTKELTFDLVTKIANETNISPAAHLTCVNAPREEIDQIAQSYLDAGVNKIVALRGDPPNMQGKYEPHPDGYAYADELVEGLQKIGDFDISVAAFPEAHPEATSLDDDINFLKQKIDKGASRAITQYCFDTDTIISFIEKARKAGIKAPIVPGIISIFSFKQAVNFSEKCGATIPKWMYKLFEDCEDNPELTKNLSALIATEQCRLLMQEGINEFHFYTLNRFEVAAEVCHVLGVRQTK